MILFLLMYRQSWFLSRSINFSRQRPKLQYQDLVCKTKTKNPSLQDQVQIKVLNTRKYWKKYDYKYVECNVQASQKLISSLHGINLLIKTFSVLVTHTAQIVRKPKCE